MEQESFQALPTSNTRAKLLVSTPIRLLLFLICGLIIGGYVLVVAMVGDSNIVIIASVIAIMGFAMVLTRDVEKVLLAGILVEFSFELDKFFFIRDDIDFAEGLPGLGISITTILLAGLYIFWIAKIINTPAEQRTTRLGAVLPSGLYLIAVIVSATGALDHQAIFFEGFLLVQNIFLLIYLVNNTRTRQQVNFILSVLMFITLLQSLLMIYQYFTHFTFEFLTIKTRVIISDSYTRVGGTFGHPNTAGAAFPILLLTFLGLSFSKVDTQLKMFARLTFILGCAALVFTFSRGGWLSLALMSSVFTLISLKNGWLRVNYLFILAAPGFVFFSLFSQPIIKRLTQTDTAAIEGRLPLNDMAFQMIADNPLFGVGANNFGLVVPSYAADFGGIWLNTVHNKYLLVWSETGIIGLVCFLGVLLSAVYIGWRYVQRDQPLSPLALGMICGISAMMMHMMVDTFNRRPVLQILWIIISVLFALYFMKDTHEPSRSH